ncbi:ATP:cob(I)alamin adenosyltransferase [Anaerorhabdus sp.]|uniref:ATP:cob(I)alamin adenosyltransferase n=1 Tax=Anaerorhabdus sp. TaxID=1872524 RepID=UPI002FC64FB1
MKDTRACAYSFLYESSSLCDYEIATDELASETGLAMHYVKHSDLSRLVELIYHANGSMRAKMAIEEEDINYLTNLYDEILNKIGSCKYFVLPQGSLGASYLHCLRSKTKAIIRIIHKIDQEEAREKRPILHDFFNLLSNIFFLMALVENKGEHIEEKQFTSKSYGC